MCLSFSSDTDPLRGKQISMLFVDNCFLVVLSLWSYLCVHLSILREEEAIQLDGLNAAQIKELREKSEKHAFQAEVNRMMKLIINSLYKNKEVSRNKVVFWSIMAVARWFLPLCGMTYRPHHEAKPTL